MASKEKHTVCFVGDRECALMIEAAGVSCVYSRAASALTRACNVHMANNLFEDVVFAIEACKAMKLKKEKTGRIVGTLRLLRRIFNQHSLHYSIES
jgi:hypothetical protein